MSDQPKSIKEILQLAQSAEKKGDVAGALIGYSEILAKAPGHSKARRAVQKLRKLHGVGKTLTQADVDRVLVLLQSSRFEEAANATRILISIAPKEALLHNILGLSLVNTNDYSGASTSFRAAVKINPQYTEALSNLGSALVQMGSLLEAIRHLQSAVKQNPNMAEAYHNIAIAYKGIIQPDDALENVEHALRINPGYVNAMNTKGTILQELGRIEEAKACIQAGLNIEPANSDLLISLGSVYAIEGDLDRAKAAMEIALPGAGDAATPKFKIGVLLGQMGRREDAIKLIKEAVTIDPTLASGYRSLGMLHQFSSGDPLISEMEGIYQKYGSNPGVKMHLGFALGKAYEDLGEYEKSFDYLLEGNRQKRKIVSSYSTKNMREQLATIQSTFDHQTIERLRQLSVPTEKPVFIVGMNRSGTTLVEQILASHSQFYGADELIHVDRFGQRNFDKIGDLPNSVYIEFCDEYLAHLDRVSGGNSERVSDKLPVNFRWIGLIKGLFPKAKIINLTRDPRDNCLSIFKNFFESPGNQYAYDLVELAEYYVSYKSMMDHWHLQFPGEIHEVSYEDLTASQEKQSRRMLMYCGLDWEDGVLEFHKTKRDVKTASVGQVREKMYQKSVKSWQNYETQLKPLIDVLEKAGRLPSD